MSDPQWKLAFSAMPNGATFMFLHTFCARHRLNHGNPIVSHKYKLQWDKMNHNIINCNIKHFTFKMLYYYFQL